MKTIVWRPDLSPWQLELLRASTWLREGAGAAERQAIEDQLSKILPPQSRSSAVQPAPGGLRSGAVEGNERGGVAGVLMLGAAICFASGIFLPDQWWLFLLAVVLGGTGMVGGPLPRRESPRAVLPQTGKAPTPAHEVDVLCDALLVELRQSPDAVRQFLQASVERIESLRAACKALDSRRKELRTEDNPARIRALQEKQQELQSRAAATKDAETSRRWLVAAESAREQQESLERISVHAERANAEYHEVMMRIEELRTRLRRARTASGPPVDELRSSIERLNQEVVAITDAVEEAQAPERPGGPIDENDVSVPSLKTAATRQRA